MKWTSTLSWLRCLQPNSWVYIGIRGSKDHAEELDSIYEGEVVVRSDVVRGAIEQFFPAGQIGYLSTQEIKKENGIWRLKDGGLLWKEEAVATSSSVGQAGEGLLP